MGTHSVYAILYCDNTHIFVPAYTAGLYYFQVNGGTSATLLATYTNSIISSYVGKYLSFIIFLINRIQYSKNCFSINYKHLIKKLLKYNDFKNLINAFDSLILI